MTECRLQVNRCIGLAGASCRGGMRCVIEQGLYVPVPVTTFTAWNQNTLAYYGGHMAGQLANTALDRQASKRKNTAPVLLCIRVVQQLLHYSYSTYGGRRRKCTAWWLWQAVPGATSVCCVGVTGR